MSPRKARKPAAAASSSPWANDAHPQSMRAFLARLEASGELLRLSDTVSLDYEISAWLDQTAAAEAVLFENIDQHALRGVGNLLNSLERVASGLGFAPEQMQAGLNRAIADAFDDRHHAGIGFDMVLQAPCQEVCVQAPDLQAELPAPRFFPAETGRYITAGVVIARDSVTGQNNASFARIKLLEGNKGMVGIAPNHHLAVMARAAKARGEKLDIAVAIGNHPAVLMAAALYLRLGDDELRVASQLMGKPLQLTHCRSVDLNVPAHCEIVLEGVLDIDETHEEVLVSEYHGMYEAYGRSPVAQFHCMTRRSDAIFQIIEPGYYPEHTLIGGVSIAAGLAQSLRSMGLPVREVAVGHGGCGRLEAVVSLSEHRPGEPRRVMFLLWAAVNLVKNVTVVDADIDPWNLEQVNWAVNTRMRADRDLVVVPDARTDRSEPTKHQNTVAKWGRDATRHADDREDWTLARPPEAQLQQVAQRLRELRKGAA